ncbi:MAG: hypothetical protein IKS48_00225 [Eubacterium sp.]|nr:hypothetical protein [Eubacterium sp.]
MDITIEMIQFVADFYNYDVEEVCCWSDERIRLNYEKAKVYLAELN